MISYQTLQKKYPKMWDYVYNAVYADIKERAKTIAHNAAFEACFYLHKQGKRAEVKPVGGAPKEAEPVVFTGYIDKPGTGSLIITGNYAEKGYK